jgi:hypothetical protein
MISGNQKAVRVFIQQHGWGKVTSVTLGEDGNLLAFVRWDNAASGVAGGWYAPERFETVEGTIQLIALFRERIENSGGQA